MRDELHELASDAASEPPPERWPLDMPLLKFSEADTWHLRDAVKGVFTVGGAGSGKTSATGHALETGHRAATLEGRRADLRLPSLETAFRPSSHHRCVSTFSASQALIRDW
jgi:hypothetical protein